MTEGSVAQLLPGFELESETENFLLMYSIGRLYRPHWQGIEGRA